MGNLYYTDDKLLDDAKLPSGYHYVGIDFNDVPLCKSNSKRSIYTFGYGHTDGIPYYGGIKELLFFSLLRSLDDKICFDDCVLNTKIENKDIFKNYEIKDVHTHCRYFFKDNQLIACDGEFYYYNIYKGGILDLVVDDDCV
ncbi:MAG: hypothetical protein Q3971_05025 [Moraxella sp.]|nr:hypothetical protein [Moraxella sp.]